MPTLIVGLSGGVPSTPMIELESSFYLAKFSEYEKKDTFEKASTSIFTMGALAQSSYLSGILICVVALGIRLSPAAIGPGGALFTAPPVFSLENNTLHALSQIECAFAITLSAGFLISLVYYLSLKYSTQITTLILIKIPHEVVLGLFIGSVLLLGYMNAELVNFFGVLLLGCVAGNLHRLGMNDGIKFMTLYAAPFILYWFTRS